MPGPYLACASSSRRAARLLVVGAVCLLAAPRTARAHEEGKYHYCGAGPSDGIEHCPWEWSAGLAGALAVSAGVPGWLAGADVAVGSVKVWPLWLGGGAHLERIDGVLGARLYLEAGAYLVFLTAGAGGSVRFAGDVRAGPHLFAGVPLAVPPARGWLRKTHWYLEPYYRPAFLFGGTGGVLVFHEVGLLFKYWSMRTHYED